MWVLIALQPERHQMSPRLCKASQTPQISVPSASASLAANGPPRTLSGLPAVGGAAAAPLWFKEEPLFLC